VWISCGVRADFADSRSDTELVRTGPPAVLVYITSDIRRVGDIQPDLEMSIVGQKLLDHAYPESGTVPGRV
jgi:hypothetical protein